MKCVVKFRLSDGGVVDVWRGPDEVQEVDERGRQRFTTEPANLRLHEKALSKLGFVNRFKPPFKPQTCHPTKMLVSATQGAIEITEAQHLAMGSLCEPNGRLRWRVLNGKLVENTADIYVSDKAIEPSSKPISGTLDLDALGVAVGVDGATLLRALAETVRRLKEEKRHGE